MLESFFFFFFGGGGNFINFYKVTILQSWNLKSYKVIKLHSYKDKKLQSFPELKVNFIILQSLPVLEAKHLWLT